MCFSNAVINTHSNGWVAAREEMSCTCGVSALPRPARMRGPCSAHAITRAGQLVAGLLVTASCTAVTSCPATALPSPPSRRDTGTPAPPPHATPARKRACSARQPPLSTRHRHASAARPVRPRTSSRWIHRSLRQCAARQELGVPAFQTLMETAAVCADNLRRCREPVLGEFRSRCTCIQRSKVCYAA